MARSEVTDFEKLFESLERLGWEPMVCGIQITNPFDQRFIQVHHKNGKKVDNRPSNLQCLCIKCHANIDENHRHRFGRGGNKRDLDDFINRYGEEERHAKSEFDKELETLRKLLNIDDDDFNTGA